MTSIAILGASGFIGTTLANQLAGRGIGTVLLTRSRESARQLWPLPGAQVVETDVYDAETLAGHLAGTSAVINLVGILNERGDDGSGFRRVHVDLTATALAACVSAGVKRYLHMSALNADPAGPSHYLRSKGEAEGLVLQAHEAGQVAATIFRPSVVFGPRDDFFNRFARLLRLTPGIFPLAAADARFQPVYVEDVAAAFIRAIDARSTYGQAYELGGPDIVTLREIVESVAELTGKKLWVVPLSERLGQLQAGILEYFPGKPLSRDNLRSTTVDSVVSGTNGLATLGVEPTPMSAVVPRYLGHGEQARIDGYRSAARRQ